MTELEARELSLLMRLENSSIHLRLYQIGNGEYVVIVYGCFYIWSVHDWYSNKNLLSSAPRKRGLLAIPTGDY